MSLTTPVFLEEGVTRSTTFQSLGAGRHRSTETIMTEEKRLRNYSEYKYRSGRGTYNTCKHFLTSSSFI